MIALPILETARLYLKPAAETDLDDLWTLWTAPQVRQFLWDDVVIERDEASQTIRGFAALAPRGLGLWTMVRRDTTSGVVGCAALSVVGTAAKHFPPIEGAVEPLVALAAGMWHQGYALEALSALVEYATKTLRLDRLVAVTDVPNIAADRLIRRAGFVPRAETDGPRHRLRHYSLDTQEVTRPA